MRKKLLQTIGSIALLASVGCSEYKTKTLHLRERPDIQKTLQHEGVEISAELKFDSPDQVHLITNPKNGILGFGLDSAYYSLDFSDIEKIEDHFILLGEPIGNFGDQFNPLTPRTIANFGADLEGLILDTCSFADTCITENPLTYALSKQKLAGEGTAIIGSHQKQGNLELVTQIGYHAAFNGTVNLTINGRNINTIGEEPITQAGSQTQLELDGTLDAEFDFKSSMQARVLQQNRTYAAGAGLEIGTKSKGNIHEEIEVNFDADTRVGRSIHTTTLFDFSQYEKSNTSNANFGLGVVITHLYPHYKFRLLDKTHSIHPELYAQLGIGHTSWENKTRTKQEAQHSQSSERLADLLRNPDLTFPLEQQLIQDEKQLRSNNQIDTPYSLWAGFKLRAQRLFPAQLLPYGSISHNGITHGTLGSLIGIKTPIPIIGDANYTYTLEHEVFDTENPTLSLAIPIGINEGALLNYLATEKRLATSILAQETEQSEHTREFLARQQGGFIQLLYTDKERLGVNLHAGYKGIGSFSSGFLSERDTYAVDATIRGPQIIPVYIGFGTTFKHDPQPKDNLHTEYRLGIGIDITN